MKTEEQVLKELKKIKESLIELMESSGDAQAIADYFKEKYGI